MTVEDLKTYPVLAVLFEETQEEAAEMTLIERIVRLESLAGSPCECAEEAEDEPLCPSCEAARLLNELVEIAERFAIQPQD